MQSLLQTDVGYDRDRLLVARMDVRCAWLLGHERQALYDRVLERLRPYPRRHLRRACRSMARWEHRDASAASPVEGYTAAPDEQLMTNEEIVTADYFDDRRTRAIVEGRLFTPAIAHVGAATPSSIRSMARRFFPAGGAVGKRWS